MQDWLNRIVIVTAVLLWILVLLNMAGFLSTIDHAPSDYLLFHLDRLVDDLVQLSADMDVDLDLAVFAGLQDAAGQLHMCSETETNMGRPP